jgi:hypothetical protein
MSAKTIGETLAALGVIASLVFVGLEIQQNTAVARAQTRQALTENLQEYIMTLASDPALFEAYQNRFRNGIQGTLDDRRAVYVMYARLRMVENVFLQVQEGVVDESIFLSYGWSKQPAFMTPQFREFWPENRSRFNPEFVAAFEAEYDLAP